MCRKHTQREQSNGHSRIEYNDDDGEGRKKLNITPIDNNANRRKRNIKIKNKSSTQMKWSSFSSCLSVCVCLCAMYYGVWSGQEENVSVCQRKSSKNTQLHQMNAEMNVRTWVKWFVLLVCEKWQKNAHLCTGSIAHSLFCSLRAHRRKKWNKPIWNRNINYPHFIAMWWTDPTWGQQKPNPTTYVLISIWHCSVHAAHIFISIIHFPLVLNTPFLSFPFHLSRDEEEQQQQQTQVDFTVYMKFGLICGFIYSARSQQYREWKMKLR